MANQAQTTTRKRIVHPSKTTDGITLKAYRGNGSVMLAMDLDQRHTNGLAGFAITRTAPGGKAEYLPNRLNFNHGVSTSNQHVWTPSNEAPFQKFRWLDVPPHVKPGHYRYEVTAMYFDGDKLKEGPSSDLDIEIEPKKYGSFAMGFTRGYLSSQAYVDKFKNAQIRPEKSLDFDTTNYQTQYEWLGGHARVLAFDFLNECIADESITVDLFAYDIDEPDFVRGLQKLGKRLRAFLDNAPLHTKPGAPEIVVHERLTKSAGAANVKVGHFKRFAHNKVMIMKKDGQPVKVLTGSANFSVRGLYVQANNMLLFDDPSTAALYAEAFEQAFSDPSGFAHAEIAEGWHDIESHGCPQFSVAFSPHTSNLISLQRVADAVQKAESSVLYAIMELAGGGAVLEDIRDLAKRKHIFSYGMSQTLTGLKVYKPGASHALVAPFVALKGKVPPPFHEEYSGGSGIVIHHKFIVIDFNGANPVVFTGSSNLASGGEEANGDNLLAIYDPEVAAAYAVEAIRLVDHYHFRAMAHNTDNETPLYLQGPDEKTPWWEPFYDPKSILNTERLLFVR